MKPRLSVLTLGVDNLEKSIVSVVIDEFKREDIPIVLNMDFGHTDPQFVMPLGVEAVVDSESKEIELAETATA